MDITKLLIGGGVGAILTGITLSFAFTIVTLNDHSNGLLGPSSWWWHFALIIGAVVGVIIGAISGLIITGFDLGMNKAIVFGLFFNFLIGTILYVFLESPTGDSGIKPMVLILIIIGFINGAVVSSVNSWQQSLK